MKDGEAAMNPDQPPQVQGPTTSSSAAEPPAEESTVGSSSPDRAQIPQQELPALTSVLTCSNQKNQRCKTQTYYVIGTAHVSQESCDRVERLIRMVEPDAIMLELCSLRTGLLEPRDSSKVMTISDLLESLRSGKKRLFEVLYSWFLSRMGEQFEYPPIRVVLGDRRSDVTVGRMWSSLSLWQRAQLLWAFLSAGVMLPIEELKEMLSRMHETDFLTEAIRELGKTCPSLIDTLIDERDRYMVAALRTMAPSHCTVVAVVGAGHLPGIRRHWDSPPSAEELQQLCVVPEPSFAVRFTATALRCTVGFAAVGTAAALLLVLSSRTARLYSACTRSAHALVH